MTTWRGEEEAIAYLSDSGDVHWLSGPARYVIEALQKEQKLSSREIHQEVSAYILCDTDDVSGHYIPYLHSLGLIRQVSS
ncbi:hypothetical protein [Pseudomaricurvus sp.]|uniref:hypothetical protein n=1 Tax=Pseudomaricurvus sp. TaxID=2004510 RepID=UPI003F6D586F